MYDQPKYKALGESDFFTDRRAARPPVPGAVPAAAASDAGVATGTRDGALVPDLPVPLTRALLFRGRERYDIYCSPCHDRVGTGDGMVVRRGYRPPPSFHVDRLRQVAIGHFFDVMTHGFGSMPDYASQIPEEDRWAIAAYIRALQYSQDAPLSEVPADRRAELSVTPTPGPLAVPSQETSFPFDLQGPKPKAVRE
jgi:mono/diheme cytochrome c family protein